MKIGRMDTRIKIQRATKTTDDIGGPVHTWADYREVWAQRRNLKGREHVEALKRSGEAETLFTIRYSSQVKDISSADRILHGAQVFDIVSPPLHIPGGRPEKIEILAKSLE